MMDTVALYVDEQGDYYMNSAQWPLKGAVKRELVPYVQQIHADNAFRKAIESL